MRVVEYENRPDKNARNHFSQIGRCMGRPLVQESAVGYSVLQMASTRQGMELQMRSSVSPLPLLP
jgi:hypothetical protein